MVVEDKIQEAKDCFGKLSKGGYNNYQKFKYIEAEDLFPIVREVCRKFKLRTKFDWAYDRSMLRLTITDQEDDTKTRFVIPLANVDAKDPGKYMQDIGRIQTYAMRYLYIQAFELAIPDEIDNKDNRKKPLQNVADTNHPKKNVKKKPITHASKKKQDPVKKSKSTTKIPQKQVEQILDKAYQEITDEGQKFDYAHGYTKIKELCQDDKALFEACKDALKIKTVEG